MENQFPGNFMQFAERALTMRASQGWPSGLGSELIIRLRQVRPLHPGFSQHNPSASPPSLYHRAGTGLAGGVGVIGRAIGGGAAKGGSTA